jgi:hypothetical protein
MKLVAMLIGVGVLLVAQHVDAQWKYTDDKGATKVTQYKLDIPQRYRDAAVWAGPTGIGRPALSEEQQQWKQRDQVYRHLGESEASAITYRPVVWGAPWKAKPRPATTATPCSP